MIWYSIINYALNQLYRCVQKGKCNGDLISNIVKEDGKCASESETCCKEKDIKQVWFFQGLLGKVGHSHDSGQWAITLKGSPQNSA